jgi:hypothetical protein
VGHHLTSKSRARSALLTSPVPLLRFFLLSLLGPLELARCWWRRGGAPHSPDLKFGKSRARSALLTPGFGFPLPSSAAPRLATPVLPALVFIILPNPKSVILPALVFLPVGDHN